jgi:hypothetical protein
MAIAFDTSISFHSVSNNTAHSWTHTCSGSNRILWNHVMNSNAVNISSATYNGTAMTSAVANTATQRSTLLYLVAPSTGANTLTVNLASSSYCYANSASYTGAKQSGQPDATASNDVTASPIVTTLTTIADNSWSILGARDPSAGSTSASTNSTQREADAGYAQLYDSNGPKTPAGSFSMTITATSGNAATAMASFAPSTAAAVNSNFLAFM